MFCIVYFALFLGFREQEGAVLVEGVGRRAAQLFYKKSG